MKREERALWALDVMGEIDPAVVMRAEGVGLRARLWRGALLAAALFVCLGAIGAGVAALREHFSQTPVKPPVSEHLPPPVYLDGGGEDLLYTTPHVRWGGVLYYAVEGDVADLAPGEPLTTVCYDVTLRVTDPSALPEGYDAYLTSSNVIPVGGTVYTCAGYTAGWRICGYDAAGQLHLFEVDDRERLAGQSANFYVPDAETVARIGIENGYGIPLGEVTDSATIASLLEHLAEGYFISRSEFTATATVTDDLTLTLDFTDGTSTAIRLYGESAEWWGYLALPKFFHERVERLVLYRGWALYLDAGFNYGNRYANNFEAIFPAGKRWMPVGVRLVGSRILADSWGGEPFVFADDAAGDLHLEGIDLYYRTLDGAIVRLRYDHPDMKGIPARLLVGENFFPTVAEREVVDGGSYTRFQMRDGVRFTLTADGTLARNGEAIAADVRDFCLDGEAVIYATPTGVYRRMEADGNVLRLSDCDVTHVATAGLYIYYATAGGELECVRCDGAQTEPLAQMTIADLALVSLGRDAGSGLAILDTAGRAWVLTDGVLWLLDEGVAAIDDSEALWLVYENGHIGRDYLELREGYLTWGRCNRLRKLELATGREGKK